MLAGIYPIAQLQEPYSAIRYLAERIPMIDILKIQHPELEAAPRHDWTDQKSHEWSPLDICEGKLIKNRLNYSNKYLIL